jgi:hypothetical protein
MAGDGFDKPGARTLPVVLIAAAVQGWALYALHIAIKGSHWPATAPGWLLALYAIALFVPLTVQLTAQHSRTRAAWAIEASLAFLFFYFGWHHGASVLDDGAGRFAQSGEWFPMVFVLGVLWLLLLPFIQCRLAQGLWRVRYESLFATAWRNKLMLAEAALFTGLFWLLLFLWQQLFKMIGIGFFKELFEEPLFVYPVTSLAFGIALHLIGSIERVTAVVLEQLLNVLKWLALVAGLILAFFTVALILKLPGMIASGERAISAAWLLWLVAVTVLLVNAAYRDGLTDEPYPRWIGLALRCVIPLVVIVGITALYALYIRIDAYGFTVERVWACIVAAAACIYAGGYAFAALRPARWMAGVSAVNVFAALFLIAAVGLALTPVLSPYRIAANSQFALAQQLPRPAKGVRERHETPMHYLRFSAGKYGEKRLQELAALQNHPRAEEIRAAAAAMIAQQNSWQRAVPADLKRRLAAITIFPADRSIEDSLMNRLEADLRSPQRRASIDEDTPVFGAFVDLNADQLEEFVLIVPPSVVAYEHRGNDWRRVGNMIGVNTPGQNLLTAIGAGDIHVEEPAWRELRIGRQTFHLEADGGN